MGQAMASHLLAANYTLTVYNRSAAKTKNLVHKGAILAHTPAEVARNSDLLFLMVGFPSDVEQVLLDPKTGALSQMKPGSVVCDLTTSSLKLSVDIFNLAKKRGVMAMDAPVTGGDVGAREAKLTIMVGAESDAFALVEPVLKLFGNPVHCGAPGQGQVCKMANQITIASCMIGICEGLLFAHKVHVLFPFPC